jgi:SulP family sulfate permease
LAFRPEGSLLYLNAEYVLASVLARLETADAKGIRNVVCDLSAAPMMDLAGARSLAELYDELQARDVTLTIVNAHGRVRDLLRAEGLGEKIHGMVRGATISDALRDLADVTPMSSPVAAEATATIAPPTAIKGPDTPVQRPNA